MASTGSSTPDGKATSKAVIIGFALVATGGVISMLGIGITSAAAIKATRRWLKAQQEPPAVVARRKFAQAKAATSAATSAGTTAWHNGLTAQRTR